ncbi:MAG: tryptophan synthase subunit alpha [Acidimicrobiia bacterium]
MSSEPTGALESHLQSRIAAGHKLLMPYLTAGYQPNWARLVEAVAQAGADAIEVGIPFSDPVMDGPTIQLATEAALARGVTPGSVIDEAASIDCGIPLVAMTYFNIPYRMGLKRYAAALAEAGFAGSILPDLPLEESPPWTTEADQAGIATVMLAAPTGSDERLARICERTRGFVYGVGLVGITGERAELAASATAIAKRLKALTNKPVAIGIGVSTPEQAVAVAEVADGVIIGSAIIRKLMDHGFEAAVDFVGEIRLALDRG